MLRENLKDAAEIISNILTQPLDVPGASTPQVSLLTAILNYDKTNPEQSDLSKILQSLVKYPEPTQMLIQELQLLSRDLSS